MPPEAADHGAGTNDWIDLVRRARLGPTVKLVALVIASYARGDGTRIFPGVARLAVQCEIDYRTAQRALAKLRKAGLVEVTRRGARRAGKSDEYRLIIAEDVLERITVPTPAAERVAIERVAEPRRNRSTRHPRPVEPSPEPPDHTSPVSPEPRSTRQGNPVLHDTGAAPTSIDVDREGQPPSDDDQVPIPRTGSARAREADPHTRNGTSQIYMAEADKLNEWMQLHPELA